MPPGGRAKVQFDSSPFDGGTEGYAAQDFLQLQRNTLPDLGTKVAIEGGSAQPITAAGTASKGRHDGDGPPAGEPGELRRVVFPVRKADGGSEFISIEGKVGAIKHGDVTGSDEGIDRGDERQLAPGEDDFASFGEDFHEPDEERTGFATVGELFDVVEDHESGRPEASAARRAAA